ncbi:hypothetical protein [Streptomyces sp. NPDC056144]|uniref:hypothetical protein n=1 Tax=unclassified Streptomyces TaxID=2593676 RepID=UPI0035DE73B2
MTDRRHKSAPAGTPSQGEGLTTKAYLSKELRDEGRAEGRAQGRVEGRAQAGAEAILLVLEQRGLDVPDDVRNRITSCTDADLLRTWLTRSVTAASAEETFDLEA